MKLHLNDLRRIIKEELNVLLREAASLNAEAVEAIKKHMFSKGSPGSVKDLAMRLWNMGVRGEAAITAHVEEAAKARPAGEIVDPDNTYSFILALVKAQPASGEKSK
jgi:hypothetical protein